MTRYLAILALITLGLVSTAPIVSAVQPIQGYVAYNVTIGKSSDVAPRSFNINESAQPTNQNGFEIIAVSLSTPSSNLTYSRLVNTSGVPEIFPFLPGITNQSFSYDYHGVSIAASIFFTGSVSVTFDNQSYSDSNYTFDARATNSSSGTTASAFGSVVAMPSGLVYSLKILVNGTYSVESQLVGTNLPLVFSSGVN